MDALTPNRWAAHLRGRSLWRSDIPRPTRPRGRVLWIHGPPDLSAMPLLDVRDRLEDQGGPVTLLCTGGTGSHEDITYALAPEDPRGIQDFLEHWRPDIALWFGRLEPKLLIDAASKHGVPMHLMNPEIDTTPNRRSRRVERLILDQFRVILASDDAKIEVLREAGLGSARIEMSAPLTVMPRPLPANEIDREEFAAALGTRPVWVAMMPTEEEVQAVLRAHAQALRTAHRLLLVLVPETDAAGAVLSERLTAEGWKVEQRSRDDVPDNGTEIYVADSVEEIGLWYRVAPLCFLGGTLSEGSNRDPLEAAGLGTGVIAGPEGGQYQAALSRLDRATALRRVTSADGLGRAVSDLTSPDRVAMLAHRAWDVATEGAEVVERLASHLEDALSERAS